MKLVLVEKLKAELKEKGMSMYQVAKLTGIRYELLRRSMNQTRELRAKELVQILDVTGIEYEKVK